MECDARDVDCSFERWASGPLRKHAGRHVVLPLPAALVSLIDAGGPLTAARSDFPSYRASEIDDSDVTAVDPAWSDADEAEDDAPRDPELSRFERSVAEAVAGLGGSAFARTNWTAPKDALFMTPDSTLRCTTPSDVVLLLRSSNFTAQDLAMCKQLGVQPVLVLKRWKTLSESAEFRCFVFGGRLVAACQRYTGSFYEFLPASRERIAKVLHEFHSRVVSPVFPLRDYMMDVHVDQHDRVLVVDMSPLDEARHHTAGQSLFTWADLQAAASAHAEGADPLVRVIESQQGVIVSDRSAWGVPFDLVGGESSVEELAAAAREFVEKEEKNQNP
eukprot:m51a1_g1730 hypothetical protein (332) ;mRNA; f:146749-148174